MTSTNTTYTPFTNSLYDTCNLDKKYQESTGPFNWITDSQVVESKEACHVGFSPFMQNQFNSIPLHKVDAESELRNQTRKRSRCPIEKFDPTKFQPTQNELRECSNQNLVPTYTRLNKPCNLPGVSINRFTPLCEDPQNLTNIHANNYIGKNTRLQVKDDFKLQQQPLLIQSLSKNPGQFIPLTEGAKAFQL